MRVYWAYPSHPWRSIAFYVLVFAVFSCFSIAMALTGCRAPDEYRVDYGQTTGTIEGRRSSFDQDTDTVTLGLAWDAGERRSRRTETLERLDALKYEQVSRETSVNHKVDTQIVPESDLTDKPESDPLIGLEETLYGSGGLALLAAAFFRDTIALFFRRRFGKKPE